MHDTQRSRRRTVGEGSSPPNKERDDANVQSPIVEMRDYSADCNNVDIPDTQR